MVIVITGKSFGVEQSFNNTAFLNFNINSSRNKNLSELLFDYCEDCGKMASTPHGAFAVCRLRSATKYETTTITKIQTWTDKQESKQFSNKKLMEYTPVKYNSKLMNSIWGLYNRYSPHNIKGNDDEAPMGEIQLQQPLAVAAYSIAKNVAMGFETGNEWKFPGKRIF